MLQGFCMICLEEFALETMSAATYDDNFWHNAVSFKNP